MILDNELGERHSRGTIEKSVAVNARGGAEMRPQRSL